MNPLRLWAAGLYFLLAGACFAALAPAPQAGSLVVDQVGALGEGQRMALEARLRALQEGPRAQVAVLISAPPQGEALAAFSLRVAEGWQLGRSGKDDGLLILLVPADTAARLEVGYGLEGLIPDALASRWLREDLLPAMKSGDLAAGLNLLLDRIEAVLPPAAVKDDSRYLFPDHPEWRLPFLLAVFSPFALFPLFMSRGAGLVSAPLLATFLGGAAWLLWGTCAATVAVATLAFCLPLTWRLNGVKDRELAPWLQLARTMGNLLAVLLFFALISLFVGATLLEVSPKQAWAGPFFAGMLALGLAVFLFPEKAKPLMLLLRSYSHFAFILIIVWLALMNFTAEPERIALVVAGAFTALIALALYADSRREAGAKRWSHVLTGLAFLIVTPFVLFLLYQAALAEAPGLSEATAGGASFLGLLAWALRTGFFAALSIGLGGRFGGGGASGRD